MNVILAGGPEHGRRLDLGSDVKEYVTVAATPLPPISSADPRPSWWQPIRRLRWKLPPPPAPPSLTQCSYRRDGELADGTPVYWFRPGLSTAPPQEGELQSFLFDALYAVPPRDRQSAVWVMDPDWHRKVCHLAAEPDPGDRPPVPSLLLGRPVRVTEDGGVPHLEVSRDR